MAKAKDKEAKVVAEFTVTSSEGTEVIRTFCAAWIRAWELPAPVRVSHTGWVRND